MSRTRVVHVNDNVPGAVYIGRAMPRRGLKKSVWANPHKTGDPSYRAGGIATRDRMTREQVIDLYRIKIEFWLEKDEDWRNALRAIAGKPLACWCRHDGEERTPDNACHGDVLVELIEAMGLEEEGNET